MKQLLSIPVLILMLVLMLIGASAASFEGSAAEGSAAEVSAALADTSLAAVESPLLNTGRTSRLGWEDAESVESGRKALRKFSGWLPWYDAQKDDLRRVDVPPDSGRARAQNRSSSWETNWQQQSTNTGVDLSWLYVVMKVVAYIVLAALLVGLVVLLIWAFVRSEGRAATLAGNAAGSADDQEITDAARVENLPFQVNRPTADLLAEARKNYEAGNYGEAIIYLFSYQLVQLDRHHLIRLTKGKTNRQYLREVRRRAALVPILERTMIAFEDVFFGNHELDRERFEGCWSGLDDFHRQVEQASTT